MTRVAVLGGGVAGLTAAHGTVLDRLTAATRVMIARAGGRHEMISAAHR